MEYTAPVGTRWRLTGRGERDSLAAEIYRQTPRHNGWGVDYYVDAFYPGSRPCGGDQVLTFELALQKALDHIEACDIEIGRDA